MQQISLGIVYGMDTTVQAIANIVMCIKYHDNIDYCYEYFRDTHNGTLFFSIAQPYSVYALMLPYLCRYPSGGYRGVAMVSAETPSEKCTRP